ncbi:MAG: hypothetical protein HHJ12_08945 [Glaciimonas sp.]|nr:hypothetical protein [Glaciimonas sp.]
MHTGIRGGARLDVEQSDIYTGLRIDLHDAAAQRRHPPSPAPVDLIWRMTA